MRELHPGGPSVIALARTRGALHFAQQRVHLGDREHAAGADGAVAGHRREHQIEPFTQQQRIAVSTSMMVKAERMSSRERLGRWMRKFMLANSRTESAMPVTAVPVTETPISVGVRIRDASTIIANVAARLR